MLKAKPVQTDYLLDPWRHMEPKRRARLEASWAGFFREQIFARLPLDALAPFFCRGVGRPAKDLRAALGVLLFQQQFDLTDEETVEEMSFNEQWHYALHLDDESDAAKYWCLKTLWNYRNVVATHGLANVVFREVADALARVFPVDARTQRLDSVHVQSAMRRLSRLSILARVAQAFLKFLRRREPEAFAALPAELVARRLPKKDTDPYARAKPSQAQALLAQAAADLRELLERFGSHPQIPLWPVYRLMRRVWDDQCVVIQNPDGSVVAQVKPDDEIASSSLQNPSDPDAGCGHKGQGYSAQAMETYSDDPDPEVRARTLKLVTYAEPNPANESDAHAAIPAIDDAAARQMAPERLVADAAYGGDANCAQAAARGTEIVAPVLGNPKAGRMTLDEFEFNSANEIVRCPAGHAPTAVSSDDGVHGAAFAPEVCAACERRAACPARQPVGCRQYFVRYDDRALRSARRRAHEKTPAFRETYRWRQGIEAAFSACDRRTGLKHLRVRGLAAVRYCVKLKFAGLNLYRATRLWARLRGENPGAPDPLAASFAAVSAMPLAFLRAISAFGRFVYRVKERSVAILGHGAKISLALMACARRAAPIVA